MPDDIKLPQRRPILLEDLTKPKLADTVNNIDSEDDRKTRILKLRLRGHSQQEIADALNISLSTVKRDLEKVKLEYSTSLSEEDRKALVQETIAGYDDILERAWYEYEQAPKGSAFRLKALELAKNTRNDKLKALQECGLVEVTSDKVEHTVSFDAIKEWTPEFQALVAQAIIETRLTPRLEPPKTEDIEIIEIKEAIPASEEPK